MKVGLTKGRPALRNEISLLRRALGESPPADFVEFVSRHDGAEPDPNSFKVGAANESGINGFIPVWKIVSEARRIENLPKRSFPIAWAEGGNYVFVNLAEGGAVFFWDHERPESVVRLANGFAAFLETLEPFDVGSISLNPGRVGKAWIDPDFLESLD